MEAAEHIAAPIKDGSHSCHFDQKKYLDKLWIYPKLKIQVRASDSVSQCTKRNLIEAKKNKSLPWLDTQATEEQHKVIEMATKQRETVKSKKHMASIKDQRQQSMMETITKQKDKEMRLDHLKRELSSVLIVIDKDHLDSILKEIDDDKHMNGSQKVDKKENS